jgi:dihydroneopterin aldolase
MEKIRITGLSVEAYIGVPKIERAHPQKLLIDLSLEADLSKAVEEDNFDQTIDYQKLVEKIKRTVASKSFSLIEGLAGIIAEVILNDARVAAVTVTVKKFPSQLRDHVENVSVEITRRSPRPDSPTSN